MKILLHEGKEFFWKQGDLHSQHGVIKEGILKKAKTGSVVKTHLGKKFLVLDASFNDKIKHIKRGPAIILPKDIGLILTNTSINKNSIVLDAGTGSGVLASYLAQFVKKVYSYEINKDFYNLARKNFEFLGINNIVIKNKDIYKKIDEKNLDLIVLDLLEPWKALNNSKKALKKSGYLVAYLPNITQVQEFIKKAQELNFLIVKVSELIEREWHVEQLRLRPKSQLIGHTGFLCFVRNI